MYVFYIIKYRAYIFFALFLVGYEEGINKIHNINLRFKKNKSYAIVGGSKKIFLFFVGCK